MQHRPAILALEDGRVFNGRAAGAITRRGGEVVFNTSLTGYQEVFTDPSYAGQIVCLTYPHIGNVGANLDDQESARPYIESLIVREFSQISSNWRSAETAQLYLNRHKIPVIWDIDTRALVRHLRKVGALRGVVATDGTPAEQLIHEAKQLPSMAGQELASRVSCEKTYKWDTGSIDFVTSPWTEQMGESGGSQEERKLRVVAYDYGIKQNILRLLVDHHCEVAVVPGANHSRRCARHGRRRRVSFQRPGRPGTCDLRGGRYPQADRQDSRLWHLPGSPVVRPGARRKNLQAEVRPSRRRTIR